MDYVKYYHGGDCVVIEADITKERAREIAETIEADNKEANENDYHYGLVP
jgi:hypothetical protein